jgi:uncharacterized protein YbjQ (UPF0145 family)
MDGALSAHRMEEIVDLSLDRMTNGLTPEHDLFFRGGLQTILGGKITIYQELCEHTRSETFRLMVEHAEKLDANAVIGMRYDANEVLSGVTEVLCYGTAVVVEPVG